MDGPTRPGPTPPSLLSTVTDQLLASYREDGAVNVAALDVPSRRAVSEILARIESVLFPGFVHDERLDETNLAWATGHKVALLHGDLRDQIARSLPPDDDGVRGERARVEADAIATGFCSALPELRRALILDVDALLEGDPAAQSTEEIILAYPGLQAIVVHRVAHHLWKAGARLLARMMSEAVHGRTGVDIHPGATIGERFTIDHGHGVVIGETSVIGDAVKIYQGATLGALSVARAMHGKKRHPTIEDHVTIYAGATILGGDTVVGHHSIIGGNVWLIRSVPSFSVVENEAKVRVRAQDGAEGWHWEI